MVIAIERKFEVKNGRVVCLKSPHLLLESELIEVRTGLYFAAKIFVYLTYERQGCGEDFFFVTLGARRRSPYEHLGIEQAYTIETKRGFSRAEDVESFFDDKGFPSTIVAFSHKGPNEGLREERLLKN